MDHTTKLEKKVLAALRPCLGLRLESVHYCVLSGECEPEELDDPDFYFGGELHLLFEGNQSLILTWDDAAGWEHHFSIQARHDSAFLPNRLIRFDGGWVDLWKRAIGQRLRGTRVFGSEGTPHVLDLCLGDSSVLVGDGRQDQFVDGDDVVVRPGEQQELLAGLDLLIELGNAQG